MTRRRMLQEMDTRSGRPGFLLPIVLVTVSILALAISIFAQQMLAEYRLTHGLSSHLAAGCAADSGIEYAWHVSQSKHRGSYRTSELFGKQTIAPSASSFVLVPSYTHVDQSMPESLGLYNESGKLNLNGLPTDLANVDLVRNRLMQLPRMTPQIADAIMDWIDSDAQTRPVGAEAAWYTAQRTPRVPAGEKFKELSELLYVRGVTEELLFGEDSNHNGWLDANENDGSFTLPQDNADGELQRGWSAFLTIVSAESNMRGPHLPKVYLNHTNLVQLYDELLPTLGQDATTFIVALRLNGPRQQGNVQRSAVQSETDERVRSAPQRLKEQLDQRSQAQAARGSQLRGGLDLSAQPAFSFRSLVDLIDQEVLTIRDGQQVLLRSPWSVAQIDTALASLEQVCTTESGPANLSRINIAYAPYEVLRSIPRLEGNQAKAIVSRGRKYASARSIGWLLSEGILTLQQLREVAPYMTAGGDVWSGSSIGWTEGQPTGVARHFVFDASLDNPRIVSVQDSLPMSLKSLKGLIP